MASRPEDLTRERADEDADMDDTEEDLMTFALLQDTRRPVLSSCSCRAGTAR
ncbi:hypothetical protein [Sorangium sp. So ce131]|uniref:hypothetical protein n=1 Tax=Sorangium sp. So ce131 TaxID=3133282 RepID=UPI003F64361A